MIYDSLLLLAGYVDAAGVLQAERFSAVGATASINAIPTGLDRTSSAYVVDATGRDFGDGTRIKGVLRVTSSPAGSGTIAIELVAADDEDFVTNLVRLSRTADFTPAQLPLGAFINVSINSQRDQPRRFIGIRVVISGAALSSALGLFGGIALHGDSINQAFNTRWGIK
ncbi:MAG: hypothetical protein ACKVOX_05680 [Rhizobacter sp.]